MAIRSRDQSGQNRKYREAELADLFDKYYDKIARYAVVHVGNKEDAQDIAAEVFLRALKSIDRFDQRGIPVSGWLFKIAHNLVVDHLRKNARRRTVDIENVVIPEGGKTLEQKSEENIEIERVKLAMNKLTPDQRQVVSLRFLGELSSKETAQVVGKTDGAVREMQRAALSRLRIILAGGR